MNSLWQTQRRSTACGLLSGVFLVTAIVLSRRISGDAAAFTSELAACLTGIAASLVAILAASLPELVSNRLPRPQRTLLISACGIPGIMLGLAVMPTGSSMGLACLLGLYLAAVLTVSALESDVALTTDQRADASPVISKRAGPSSGSSIETGAFSDELNEPGHKEQLLNERRVFQTKDSESDDVVVETCLEEASDEATALPFELNGSMPHPASNPDTTQWMSRSQVDGLDVAEGAFRVRFAAGQRLAPVHLPFSPPLADTPEFECEPADDSDLRFRTTAVHAYGIRIEVSRSSDCNEEATVEVAWMASATLSESVAA
ncbi:MAG: hypothetical protein HQ518_18500 [Rhodopirellula sp.]|nr:hypothetical protein [Rhodopirellula sp.]